MIAPVSVRLNLNRGDLQSLWYWNQQQNQYGITRTGAIICSSNDRVRIWRNSKNKLNVDNQLIEDAADSLE